MASIKMDFRGCIEALEALEDQRFDLGARISTAIFDDERTIFGLINGDVSLFIMGKDIIKLESPNLRHEVTYLCWVGAEKCISGHMKGPSRLWDLAKCREIAVFDADDRESEECDTAAALDSNCRVVIGSSSGHLRLWELEPIKQIASVKAHHKAICKIFFVGDECVTSSNADVKIWDLSASQLHSVYEIQSQGFTIFDCTKEGRCFFAMERHIKVWDLSERKEIFCYKGHQRVPLMIKLIDGDRCVSYADTEEKLRMWSTKDFTDIQQFPFHAYYVEVKKNLLFCATMNGLSVIDITTNQTVATINLNVGIRFVHYFEGKCLCVPFNDYNVIILEMDEYRQMHELTGHVDTVNITLPWGADKLVSSSHDGTLRVWDLNQLRELAVLRGHGAFILNAALINDERCLSCDLDGYIKIWDLSSMKEIPTNMKHPTNVECIATTSNNKAVTGDSQRNIFVWDLSDYSKIGELKGHTDSVTSLVLISDEMAISGSRDKTVRVWDILHFAVLAILDDHQKSVNSLALACDNRCLSVSSDKTLKVWNLKKRVLLTTLRGHVDEVWKVAVTGQKCASGSKDKTIILWNLTNYLQEARLMCSNEVVHLLFTSSTQLVSGDWNGEMKVWEDFREVARFNGFPGYLIKLTKLSNFRLAVTYDYCGNVQIFDLGQLYPCLSQCSNHAILEKEASENKPLLPQYRSRLSDFKSGKRVPQPECQMLFRPYFFNALHICASYNHSALLKEYLKEGVPLVRGVFGSPLTLALDKNIIECVDVILEHLTTIAQREDAWKSFQAINDELLSILSSGSSKLGAFFSALMQRPLQHVPTFIKPLVQLPLTLFAANSNLYNLGIFTPGESGEDLVKFFVSLVSWNLISGSQESIDLLTAAVDCEERQVLLGEFLRSIVQQKWDNFYPFTLSITAAYGIMLFCLIGTINAGSSDCCVGFLVLNGLFLLYELVQLFAMRSKYFTEGWNLIDIARSLLSVVWALFILVQYEVGKYMVLTVVFLNFIRGFTHFRSFRTTRIFVYMTFTVVSEMYSFLFIIAYSVFSFGIFASVLMEETSLSETWKKAYNLAMGNFDTAGYGPLEWVVFTGATVTNIIIMMNLLISILGEAYEKAQMTMLENDLHMQVSLLLEYETLMIWRRGHVSRSWVVVCREAKEGEEQLEWSGKVLQIVNSLTNGLSQMEREFSETMNGAVKAIGREITGVEEKVKAIDTKVSKVDCVEERVKAIEVKLDAVLSFLQSRS